jgi:hypothetical protein
MHHATITRHRGATQLVSVRGTRQCSRLADRLHDDPEVVSVHLAINARRPAVAAELTDQATQFGWSYTSNT